MNVEIGALVITRSPGRRLDRFAPDLLRELVKAGVPVDHAGEVASAVLNEVLSKVGR
jgi:hypothetical protein